MRDPVAADVHQPQAARPPLQRSAPYPAQLERVGALVRGAEQVGADGGGGDNLERPIPPAGVPVVVPAEPGVHIRARRVQLIEHPPTNARRPVEVARRLGGVVQERRDVPKQQRVHRLGVAGGGGGAQRRVQPRLVRLRLCGGVGRVVVQTGVDGHAEAASDAERKVVVAPVLAVLLDGGGVRPVADVVVAAEAEEGHVRPERVQRRLQVVDLRLRNRVGLAIRPACASAGPGVDEVAADAHEARRRGEGVDARRRLQQHRLFFSPALVMPQHAKLRVGEADKAPVAAPARLGGVIEAGKAPVAGAHPDHPAGENCLRAGR
mmetsp:Transcript_34165/g.109958  ORF Transcript_34165/g.109958 Transcript_34165/m.109958 type:complete len:321 (-) Transcript_34165:40-1002(-)